MRGRDNVLLGYRFGYLNKDQNETHTYTVMGFRTLVQIAAPWHIEYFKQKLRNDMCKKDFLTFP